ncbi:MAG: Mut7-C ubiquitin/RNAse domain-containing protein [Desulfohalobiaceae bacterium]|nr:Mut7-C ubiquitin/RNAse domain-containing protein [Desulfohalobiaceae bacterium]
MKDAMWCTLYFKGGLNYFLANDKPSNRIRYPLKRRASVKDLIESLGPPHTEIGEIRANSCQVDFDFIVSGGDVLVVKPNVPPVDPCRSTILRPEPLAALRFVVDVNVGKMAMLMRSLGFDTAYHWTWRDKKIAALAHEESRIVLSKDIGLLKRKKVTWGLFVRAAEPDAQLREVLNFFGLHPPFDLFSRCLRCNSLLRKVDKQAIIHRLEPKTRKYFQEFSICPDCRRIYWAGSHQEKLLRRIEAAVGGEN